MPPYEYWWHGPWTFMWLIPLAFLIVLAIFLFRGASMWGWGHRDDRHPARESALDILARRYASGEITKEQYEDMKRTIKG